MKRIDLGWGSTARRVDITSWFYRTQGQPQEWGAQIEEPVALKSGYKWAMGQHADNQYSIQRPCIWCTDTVYTWWALTWGSA